MNATGAMRRTTKAHPQYCCDESRSLAGRGLADSERSDATNTALSDAMVRILAHSWNLISSDGGTDGSCVSFYHLVWNLGEPSRQRVLPRFDVRARTKLVVLATRWCRAVRNGRVSGNRTASTAAWRCLDGFVLCGDQGTCPECSSWTVRSRKETQRRRRPWTHRQGRTFSQPSKVRVVEESLTETEYNCRCFSDRFRGASHSPFTGVGELHEHQYYWPPREGFF